MLEKPAPAAYMKIGGLAPRNISPMPQYSERGTSVPPSLFIPVAERTGAILDLGRWAIKTVCRELLVDNHIPLVSVNVSPIQLKTRP